MIAMRRPIRLALVLTAAAVAAACASAVGPSSEFAPGSTLPETGRFSATAPADELWRELKQLYPRLGLPLARVDAGARSVHSGDVLLWDGRLPRLSRRKLVFCADHVFRVPSRESGAMLRVDTSLQPSGNGTDISVLVQVWRPQRVRADEQTCRSTGVLEGIIADALRGRA